MPVWAALSDQTVLAGYDDALAAGSARLANRIRGLLTQVQPALERAPGPRVQQKAALVLICR